MRRAFRERINEWLHRGIGVGRIKGIPISLHVALPLLVAAWLITDAIGPDPVRTVLTHLLFIGILFGSILLHELGHCYGAHLVGARNDGIQLWPLGGFAFVAGGLRSPYDEFIIVLLGPLVSLALAIVGSLGLWLLPDWIASTTAGSIILLFFQSIQVTNAMLFVFNMALPLFPMDCARLIRSLFSMRYSPERVTYNICLLGFFVAGGVTTLYLVGGVAPLPYLGESNNVFLLLIAAFGLFSCLMELRMIEDNYVYSEPWRSNAPFRALLRRMKFLLVAKKQTAAKTQPPSPPPMPRIPEEVAVPSMPVSERESLETELRTAIEREDFVRAAEIRDRLRDLRTEAQRG